jgi:quercetin dioxygenase-like cupin family protein
MKVLNRTRVLILTIGVAMLAAATVAAIALGYSGGPMPTPIFHGVLADGVHVNQDGVKFQTKEPTDLAVTQFSFAPDTSSGWHHHSGVLMITVQSGTVTTHDENCQTQTYSAGQVFVESGTVPFMVSNESQDTTAVVYATQVSPDGSPARINDTPPACASS